MALITDIEEFKGKLSTGGARPTLFYITNPYPAGFIGNDNPGALSQLSYMARAASIPEEIISPISVGYFGRKIKLAGDRTYRDWSLSVINDEMFSVRRLFESWHFNLNAPVENKRTEDFTSPNSYKASLRVNQLTQEGSIAATYIIEGAFPIRIGDIKLSWDDQNTIEEFDVTFSYDYFYPEVKRFI
jgi:hypothetical protein